MTPGERFWAKVDRSGGLFACWPWLAYVKPEGYGQFSPAPNKTSRAHRVAYELAVGPIPDGLQLDHLCRNRACVNPAHLEPVTHRENALRGEAPAIRIRRSGFCKRGHPRTTVNLWTSKKTGRSRCRICHRDQMRGRYVSV